MKIIFSDFDGTLTNFGRLGAVFFDILDLIQKNNSELVIVSGRSLSWGHFLLTHFPLKYAIMEGGGVIVSKNQDGILQEDYIVSLEERMKLQALVTKMRKDTPETIFSLDSLGRATDYAIEFSQMTKENVIKAENYLLKEKANFSRSNVHINFWYGNHSKFSAVEYFIKNYMPHVSQDETIFYGDSLNDESMFEKFSNCVGVSNILSVLDELTFKPRIILEGKDNSGAYGVFHHLNEVFTNSQDF